MPARTPRFRLPHFPVLTWVVGGAIVLLLMIGATSSGIAGLLIVAGLTALITGLYVLATGRRSWALLASRSIGGIVVAGGLVLTVVAGALSSGLRAPDAVQAGVTGPTASVSPTSTEPSAPPSTTHGPLPSASPVATATPKGDEEQAQPATKDGARGTALALLAGLQVHAMASKADYDREDDFGRAWIDVDDNGCDTRNDILARDLTHITRSGQCTVLTGDLSDPYTATLIDFVRGVKTSSLVQIDHVVALANAWQTGAKQLSEAQRIALANDPLNLLAVDGRSNSQKQDKDASAWLPANTSYRCAYVARQITVKVTYRLWVTPAEKSAMQSVLSDCPGQEAATPDPVPVTVVAPAKPPSPKPSPTTTAPKPSPTSVPLAPDVYYQNCTAVRDAGKDPLYRGDPGYRSGLDRDDDGVACE